MNKFYKKGLFLLLAVTNSYSASVLIRHVMRQDLNIPGCSVESVKKHGLCSFFELVGRDLCETNKTLKSNPLFCDSIYFDLVENGTQKDDRDKTVYRRVDPEKTYVYNKLKGAAFNYSSTSMLLLRDYFILSKKTEEMKANCPEGMIVLRNPLSGEPFYSKTPEPGFRKKTEMEYDYIPEIIYMNRGCIPSSELLFWEDVNKPNEASQSN